MTQEEILAGYVFQHPELRTIEAQVRQACKVTSKAIYLYQAAALYHHARPYNGRRAMEIGTAYGYSCFYLASAMPQSYITTLNPNHDEVIAAQQTLSRFRYVEALEFASWDYYSLTTKFSREYGFIFVDGDHKQVGRDLPWFNRLEIGGLIMFHDYSPKDSARPCPPVYRAINEMAKKLGREPDVLIVDNDRVGMAGFIRRAGELI